MARLVSDACRWPIIAAELAKCEVRCGSCHTRRTKQRARSWIWLAVHEGIEPRLQIEHEFTPPMGDKLHDTAQAYVAEYGTLAFMPVGYALPDGYKIHAMLRKRWLEVQRGLRQPMDRGTELLTRLPGWRTCAGPDRGERVRGMVKQLRKHVASTGTCAVPVRFRMADGYPLGSELYEIRRTWHTVPAGLQNACSLMPGWVAPGADADASKKLLNNATMG